MPVCQYHIFVYLLSFGLIAIEHKTKAGDEAEKSKKKKKKRISKPDHRFPAQKYHLHKMNSSCVRKTKAIERQKKTTQRMILNRYSFFDFIHLSLVLCEIKRARMALMFDVHLTSFVLQIRPIAT